MKPAHPTANGVIMCMDNEARKQCLHPSLAVHVYLDEHGGVAYPLATRYFFFCNCQTTPRRPFVHLALDRPLPGR
jgi:hypothetical protein